jgi:hypothetical protein
MGWVRFGALSGFFLLGLAGVAPVAMTTNAAERGHPKDAHMRHVHHSGIVHHRTHAALSLPEGAPAMPAGAQLAEAQSTIIVVTPEPGAVATSTQPAPTTAAKPEPEAVQPAKPQAHAPGRWLIQIGAFDMEAEARQHLSEAQLNTSAALAAADPFTERVQRGDKVFYRARGQILQELQIAHVTVGASLRARQLYLWQRKDYFHFL